MKYTLKKDWISPTGKIFLKGRTLDVTQDFISAIEKKEKKKTKTKKIKDNGITDSTKD